MITSEPDDERGSVEAGLVMIPTTLLFLVLMQLVLTGSWQLSEGVRLHDLVMRSEVDQKSFPEFAGRGREIHITREAFPDQKSSSGTDGSGRMTKIELRSDIPMFSPFTTWFGDVVKTKNVAFAFE